MVANVGIFRCFSGEVLARKYARKYLRAIFARKFVKKVANMGYLLHLRPHLQAKNDLLPANLLSACKSSSFFAESRRAQFTPAYTGVRRSPGTDTFLAVVDMIHNS